MSLERGDMRRAGKRAEPELTVAAAVGRHDRTSVLAPSAFENGVTRLVIERQPRAETESGELSPR